MRNSAIVFTGIAVSFCVFSVIPPSAAVSIDVPPSSCINWVPTSSVQLAVASLEEKHVPGPDVVPHPDKDKCPCKGTGVIVHGDGHKTECPYHGKDVVEHKCKCDVPGYYCACEEEYGKCSCPALLTRAQQKKAYLQAIKNETSWWSRLFLGLRG